MSRDVKIRLLGSDELSPVFAKVSKSTDAAEREFKELERSLDGVERESQQTARSVDQLNRRAEEAARSARNMDQEIQRVARGMATLAAGVALSGRAFRDQEISVDAVRRAYGDAADGMLDFTERIQDVTNFSNDAARESAALFGTLLQNYDVSAAQIEMLMARTADLAALRGMSFEDASLRIQSAIRGEAESAEALLLTLNDTALGIDRMAKSTTDAEKAQIRIAAFMDQSTYSMGAAEAQAQGTYGALTDLAHGAQDAAQSIGGMLGPLGEVGAFAADNVIQIGASALAMRELGRAAVATRALMGAGGLAGGLATLGVAGAGLVVAGGGLYALANWMKADLPEASEVALASIDALNERIVETGDTSLVARAIMGLDEVIAANNATIETARSRYDELTSARGELLGMFDQTRTALEDMLAPIDAPIFENLTAAERAMIDTNNDAIISVAELDAALTGMLDTAQRGEEVNAALNATADEMAIILGATGEGAAEAKAQFLQYLEALLQHNLAGDDFVAGTEQIIDTLGDVKQAALEAAAGMGRWGEVTQEVGVALTNSEAGRRQWLADQERQVALTKEIAAARRELASVAGSNLPADPIVNVADVSGKAAQAIGQTAARFRDATIAASNYETQIINVADANGALVESIRAERWDRFVTALEDVQTAATFTGTALDNTFRIAVQNTNAWAQQSQAVADWATELIAAEGTYSALDDLLTNGRISLLEYNAAQQAHNDILQANAAIQEHVQAIQAQQAPLLAEATARQEAYIDGLLKMSDRQQMVAMGWMDSATATQAMSIAMADVGAMGEEAFTKMVVGAAMANPYLEQILYDMELISYGTEGEIIVHTDAAGKGISDLITSLDNLTTTLYEIFIDGDNSGAKAAISEAESALRNLDGRTATLGIGADASAFWAVYNGLPTQVSVGAQFLGIGSFLPQQRGNHETGGVVGYETGGMIGRYEGGGITENPFAGRPSVLAHMAESGAELLRFANGGTAIAEHPGLYQVPTATLVTNAVATRSMSSGRGVTINGLSIHVDGRGDNDEELARKISRALVRALDETERGQGR